MSELNVGPYEAGFRHLFPEYLGVRLISVAPELVVAEIEVSANLPAGAGTTTIESKTNFFRGGVEGTVVRGECRPLHRGRRTQVWQTTILNAEGKLVAQVTQTQMVL